MRDADAEAHSQLAVGAGKEHACSVAAVAGAWIWQRLRRCVLQRTLLGDAPPCPLPWHLQHWLWGRMAAVRAAAGEQGASFRSAAEGGVAAPGLPAGGGPLGKASAGTIGSIGSISSGRGCGGGLGADSIVRRVRLQAFSTQELACAITPEELEAQGAEEEEEGAAAAASAAEAGGGAARMATVQPAAARDKNVAL